MTGNTKAPSPALSMTPQQRDGFALVGAMQTHPGLERASNEDTTVYVLPDPGSPFARNGSLALIADGVGGHAAGALASNLAAEIIRSTYYDAGGTVPEILAACFEAANRAIHARSRSDATCAGMATTCTAVAVRGGLAYLAHVGDSRAYLLRSGILQQISQDHSVVADLVRRGTITDAEALRSPYRNLVLRALGSAPTVEPMIWREGLPLRIGDRIILCSDGLSNCVDASRIAEEAGTFPPLVACRTLIAAALKAGGPDNISIGIFSVQEHVAPSEQADQATRLVDFTMREGAAR